MSRRVSKITAAALFTVVLSLSTPSAFAAPSRDWSPDFGTRIVRILKSLAHHLGLVPGDNSDSISPPKP